MSFQEKIEHFVLKYLAVPKTPKRLEGKRYIACIGDSITFGAGVRGKKEETWEYFLNELLSETYQVLNYGLSARTLQDEGDYPYKADKFYTESKKGKIDTFLIMLGTNDAKPHNWNEERYKSELVSFVNEYKKRGEVLLMTPPSCFEDEKSGIVPFDIDKKTIDGPIQRIIFETGKECKVPVIDLHEYTKDHPEWFADGIHPNKEGNKNIARYIFHQLEVIHSII